MANYRPSNTTMPRAIRLPNDIDAILRERVRKSKGRWQNVPDYIKDKIVTDALRKR